jgi:hypothetical protein
VYQAYKSLSNYRMAEYKQAARTCHVPFGLPIREPSGRCGLGT